MTFKESLERITAFHIRKHVIQEDERKYLGKKLKIDDMDNISLINFRDFTVMYYDLEMERCEDLRQKILTAEKMTAICRVITDEIERRKA